MREAATANSIATFERVGKKFDRQWILRNVSLELEFGAVLAVTGRNGAGKSTLLKLLAGLLAPSEGTVSIPSPAHLEIGYFSLDGRIYPSLTVEEHLSLSAELRGIEIDAKEWLRRIGLYSSASLFGAQLSTGMRSRLKLALAAAHAPRLLILDEPAAGLDEAGRELIESICLEQRARGALVVATNEAFERRFATIELSLDV